MGDTHYIEIDKEQVEAIAGNSMMVADLQAEINRLNAIRVSNQAMILSQSKPVVWVRTEKGSLTDPCHHLCDKHGEFNDLTPCGNNWLPLKVWRSIPGIEVRIWEPKAEPEPVKTMLVFKTPPHGEISFPHGHDGPLYLNGMLLVEGEDYHWEAPDVDPA